jgi:methyltransferase (TIGR00027 family)
MDNSISWEDDYRQRANPQLFTELLHEAVPVLHHIGWKVLETAEGYAKTILPLNYESTNQHGTHQAALMVLAGDYTGGIALATLLRGVPFIGVHPQPSDNGGALWLVSVDIKYKAPSTGDVVITSGFAPEEFERIQRRYFRGKQCLETVRVVFESEGYEVATAAFSYFLRQSNYLEPQTPEARMNILFTHRVKASARLIAGVRAMESMEPNPLYTDPYSRVVAGTHGELLAKRFTGILPQLRHMVSARTKDADERLLESFKQGTKQVVFVGVGFDLRPYRLLNGQRHIQVFELDLPYMLAEREKLLARIEDLPDLQLKAVGINLKLEDLASRLIENGFDPAARSFFILEGASMYFEEAVNEKIFHSLRRLMGNIDSLLWVDIVAKSVIDGITGFPEIESFLSRMEKLGEPFIFGVENAAIYFSKFGFEIASRTPSDAYRREVNDPVFRVYEFFLLRRSRPLTASAEQRFSEHPLM